MIMAAGFDNLVQFVNGYKGPITLVLNAIIGLVALVLIGMQVVKLLREVKDKKWNEAGKSAGVIAIIAVIAGLGMVGVVKLGKVITPEGSDNGNFTIPQASVSHNQFERIQTVDRLHASVLNQL